MKKFENKSKNKKGKSHRFFGVSPKIQRSSNLLFPLLARGLEGIKYFLNICTCFYAQNYLIRRSLEFFANAKNRDDVFGYSYAKVLALALVLSLVAMSESWAACNGATATTAGTDEDGNYCGICNDSGTCKWKLDSSGELNVYAADGAQNVAIKDYGSNYVGCKVGEYPQCYKTTAPWGGLGATSLVIGDNIKSVGNWAFVGESRITNISGMKDLSSIKFVGFHMMQGLSELALPEGLTAIGNQALQDVVIENNLTIPETLTSVGGQAFYGISVPEFIISDKLNTIGWASNAFETARTDIIIRCQGEMEKCQAAMAKYIPTSKGGTCSSMCLTNATFEPATEKQCTSSNYYWSGKSCNNKKNGIICAEGYAEYKDKCWSELPFARKSWTPAEAAQWLNEDNNTVTLTFKK